MMPNTVLRQRPIKNPGSHRGLGTLALNVAIMLDNLLLDDPSRHEIHPDHIATYARLKAILSDQLARIIRSNHSLMTGLFFLHVRHHMGVPKELTDKLTAHDLALWLASYIGLLESNLLIVPETELERTILTNCKQFLLAIHREYLLEYGPDFYE